MTGEVLAEVRRMAAKKKLTREEQAEVTRLSLALQADMYEAVMDLAVHAHPEIASLSTKVESLEKKVSQAGWRDVITAVATALGIGWSKMAG